MSNEEWSNQPFQRTGIFRDLEVTLGLSQLKQFPSVAELTAMARKHSAHFVKSDFCFVAQDESFDWQGAYYEDFIRTRAQIPTRLNNWHDFFNACIWSLFPHTKQALVDLHCEDVDLYGRKQRSRRRDAITLFDECGIIIAYQDDAIVEQLRNHQWHSAFWQNRNQWFDTVQPFVLGHAGYEMALNPFIGLTCKAYMVKVSSKFWQFSLANKIALLDQILVEQITQESTLNDNSLLSPLPLLGVPSWHVHNEQESFYANTDYFRPKRNKRTSTSVL